MISYDFEYYRPKTVKEAYELFHSLDAEGKKPLYYSGGTEIITYGRTNNIVTGAVIDIKTIPECLVLKKESNQVKIGAAQSLTKIREMKFFPFLEKTIVEIADHTARNKITLGGNLSANIFYRETALPLLLTESEAVIATASGIEQRPFKEVFDKKLNLNYGEFLVQVVTKQSEIDLPFLSVKKRRQWDVGYPLTTTAAIKRENKIHVAFSGLTSFPFYDENIDASLNNDELSREERVNKAIKSIPHSILDDVHGSSEYRKFALKNTLLDCLESLEGA